MTLLAPLFLLGLLGIAIPVFVHRLHEQRAVVKPFPSSLLLEETRQTTTRHRRIRYRWLLAARILALAVLSLLFAEPLLKLADELLDERAEVHLYIIDDSFSMRHGERWQQALTAADSAIVSVSDGSSRIFVTRASAFNVAGAIGNSLNTQVNGNPSTDAGSNRDRHVNAKAELDRLRGSAPTNYSLKFSDVMDRAERFAKDVETPVHIHIFSDMQRSAAGGGTNKLYRESLESVTLHSVGERADHNIAIEARVIWLDETNARVDAQVLLGVADHSNGDDQSGQQALGSAERLDNTPVGHRVELVVLTEDETVLARDSVVLQPGNQAQVQLQLPGMDEIVRARQLDIADDGPVIDLIVEVRGEIVLSDQLADDNQVKLGLPQNLPARIGILPLDPENQQRDIAYLQSAFRQMHNHQVVELDSRTNAIEEDVALLFVLQRSGEVSLPSPAVDFFRRGGPVVQVLAGGSEPPVYLGGINTNAVNDAVTEENSLTAFTGVDRVVTVDPVHPLALQRSIWTSVTINRPLWRSEDLKGIADAVSTLLSGESSGTDPGNDNSSEENVFSQVADVLVATESGMPVILQPTVGAGASVKQRNSLNGKVDVVPLLVLMAPLDGISSNLPVHPVFLPFMQSLSSHMLQSGRYPKRLYTGDTLVLNSNTQLLSPELKPVYELASVGSARTHLFDSTGTYTILEPKGSHLIQVGIDPAESDIEMLSTQNVIAWQQQYTTDSTEAAGDSETAQSGDNVVQADSVSKTGTNDTVRSIALWQWLLPLLVVLLLIESLLANRAFTGFRTGSA